MKNCPSHKTFIDYVNGDATLEQIISFEKHLQQCELCAEALPVYKQMTLSNKILTPDNKFVAKTKTKILPLRYAISVAASVIILLGLFVIVKQNITSNDFATITNCNKKTLIHKSDVSYWYIGDNKQLALNDYIISNNDLRGALNYNLEQTQILLQVDNKNRKEVEIFISQLKQNNIPLYTFSKGYTIKSSKK